LNKQRRHRHQRRSLRSVTRKQKTKLVQFSAYTKRAYVDEQPDEKFVPEQFRTAKELWNQHSTKKLRKIKSLVTPFLRATFVADAVYDIKELAGPDIDEIEAKRIEITDFDFSAGPIPGVSVAALFEIPILKSFPIDTLDDWEDKHDYLDHGLSFQWELDTEEAFPIFGSGLSFQLTKVRS
jgi:hypothetical protein